MGFHITLLDQTTHDVGDADAYEHDKQMTTFYRTANSRGAVDCWATPLASIRTSEILMITRTESDAFEGEVRELLAG